MEGKTIYQKLSLIQNKLFVPKEQDNDFGKYKYRSCEDILTRVKPLCEEVDALLLLDSETLEIGGRVYAVATAKLINLDNHIDVVTSTASARDEDAKRGMDGSQISGSALSYARKYALAGLFCIDNEKDSDATNQKEEEKTKSNKQDEEKTKSKKKDEDDANKVFVKECHISTIRQELLRTGITEQSFLAQMKIESLEKLTMAEFERAMGIFANLKSLGAK